MLDAFTSGGAQIQGGSRSREIEIEDELEFTLGRAHQVTTGFTVNGTSYRADERRNANGTFTFASLDAFAAGRADHLHAAHRQTRRSTIPCCSSAGTSRTTTASIAP